MSISKSCHLPFVLTLLVIFWTCQSSDSNVTSTASEDPETFPSELYPLLITDDSRTIHQFISAPKRIISLVPSATETLLSMDLGNNLVGRTEFDIATPEIRNLPSVGLGMNPDLEILLSLNPDLVIGFSGESDTSITRHLKNSNITYFMIRPDKLEDAVEIIKRLSLITDRKSLGDSIILNINTSLEIVQQKIANKVRPRIAYVLGGEPPWVAGPGTYIHQLIIAGGGQNIFDDLEHKYAPVSLEEFFVRKLDLILLTENTRLPNALKHLRTFTISSSVEIPGPGLGEAVFEIAHGIHPQVFP